jgi:hypothetical protein
VLQHAYVLRIRISNGMSTRKQIERALKRAESRDRKRQPKMKVSGASVFALRKLINKENSK